MYPHERSLVQRLKNRPFRLLGVNTDKDVAKARAVARQKGLTWPSFYDGSDGPIATRWNVSGFPTIYVVDHEGIIRFRRVGAGSLDAVVDPLVEAAERAGRR
jgi:hypothetical protein